MNPSVKLERKAEPLPSLNNKFYYGNSKSLNTEPVKFEFIPGIRQLYPVHVVEMDFCGNHDIDRGFFEIDAIPDARTKAAIHCDNKRYVLDVISSELVEKDNLTYYEVVLQKCEE